MHESQSVQCGECLGPESGWNEALLSEGLKCQASRSRAVTWSVLRSATILPAMDGPVGGHIGGNSLEVKSKTETRSDGWSRMAGHRYPSEDDR